MKCPYCHRKMQSTVLDFLLLPRPVIAAYRCDNCLALIGDFQDVRHHVVHLDLTARPPEMCIADFVIASVQQPRPHHARAA